MSVIKKFKACRRLGVGIFAQCQSQKFVLSQARHEKNKKRRPRRLSDYGKQLIEKQKVRVFYGLSEKQFQGYVKKAMRTDRPAQTLFEILESRLDNAIYRSGFAHTRALARQMASHGHFVVNGKKTTVPSVLLKKGDEFQLREGSKKRTLFSEFSKKLKAEKQPAWMLADAAGGKVTIKGKAVDQDPFLNFQTVIEFYTR